MNDLHGLGQSMSQGAGGQGTLVWWLWKQVGKKNQSKSKFREFMQVWGKGSRSDSCLTSTALLSLLCSHLHEGVQHQSIVQPGVPVLQLLQEVRSCGLRHFPSGQLTQPLNEARDVQQGYYWKNLQFTDPFFAMAHNTLYSQSDHWRQPTLVDFCSWGASIAFLLGIFGQKGVLVVVANIRFWDGDRQDATEVGQLLLVKALDQTWQVGDSLQLDHLLNTQTYELLTNLIGD